jgi:tetratricopeptide (TPR) repeat protein
MVAFMKRQWLKILTIALGLSLLISVYDLKIAVAQQQNQFRSYIKLGIEKAFNLDFLNANINLQKAIAMDPENPTGYAFLSMMNSFAYEMTFDENVRKNYQDSMLRNADAALIRGEKKIAQNPQDNQAYFAMAMAKISKLEWAIHQKQYLTVAREASATWEYLEKAKENDQQNFDIYFLLGIFHYHIDHLPGLTRFLSSLIITSGDSQKGLQELELAAQKGDLLKQLAMSELSSNYLNFEKQPARALPLIRELKNKFPNNYNFSFALGNVLSDLGKFDDALNIARELEKNINAGLPPYSPELQPRYDLLMGRILFTKADYAHAEGYFQKALQNTRPYNARVRAWAFLRLGLISDVRNERQKAEEYYSQALKVHGGEGTAQIEAKKYMAAPYVPPPTPNGSGK